MVSTEDIFGDTQCSMNTRPCIRDQCKIYLRNVLLRIILKCDKASAYRDFRTGQWSDKWHHVKLYQTRSAWSMDQGSTGKRSFAPIVTKLCVMWEGLSLPHDTKFRNCRGEIVDRRMIFIWSLIHGSGWPGLINAEPGALYYLTTS